LLAFAVVKYMTAALMGNFIAAFEELDLSE
jgi:hypothetical protein